MCVRLDERARERTHTCIADEERRAQGKGTGRRCQKLTHKPDLFFTHIHTYTQTGALACDAHDDATSLAAHANRYVHLYNEVGALRLEDGLVCLRARPDELVHLRELEVLVLELLHILPLGFVARHDGALDDLQLAKARAMSARHLVVELLDGAIHREVTELLVRVVEARARLVADPETVGLHLGRVLLVDLCTHTHT